MSEWWKWLLLFGCLVVYVGALLIIARRGLM